MSGDASAAVDSHVEDFFEQIDLAREHWSKFSGMKRRIDAGILAVGKNATTVQDRQGQTSFVGCDIGIYADLDKAMEDADQLLERYMLAIHEMKAAFDKAMQIGLQGGEISGSASSILSEQEQVEAVFAEAMAAHAAWDKSFNAVMPLYRKFKLASTQRSA